MKARLHRPLLTALIVIAVGLIGGGVWAARAPLDSAVLAPGVLQVQGQRKAIAHQEGGTVAAVHAADGDLVEAGEILLELDETQAKAAYVIQRIALIKQWARETRLRSERDRREQLAYPPLLQVLAEEADAHDILEGERRLFATRREQLEGTLAILGEQERQLERKADGLRTQVAAAEEQIGILERQVEKMTRLLDRDYIPEPQVLDLRRNLARVRGERGEYLAELAEAEHGAAQKRLEQIQVRTDREEEVSEALGEAEAEVLDLRERVAAARYTLEHLAITAPVRGYVVNNLIHAPDQVVTPGETVMEIVPAEVPLLVEARISQADVDRVQQGQTAMVRFAQLDNRDTPIINGEVTYLSADLIEDPDSREAYFVARIRLPPPELGKLDGHRLQAGMSTEVVVKTGERTVLDYFVKPLEDSLARAFRER